MDIVVSHLSKHYGGNTVIRDFSAIFRKDQLTCIMGPSGCGKTTLLSILMGLENADSGTVSGLTGKKSAVFQEDRLCMPFSAIANVRMVCRKDISKQMIEAHLAMIGLQDCQNQPVRELSGGMQRRVAIVRAILAESDIIFLDEPFKGLDVDTKKRAIHYVINNIVGKTVLMVTHIQDEVNAIGGDLILF